MPLAETAGWNFGDGDFDEPDQLLLTSRQVQRGTVATVASSVAILQQSVYHKLAET